jgi:tetratricopeptide (TPR) repeat protein
MLRAGKIQCVFAVAAFVLLAALTACAPTPTQLAERAVIALEAGDAPRAVALLEAAADALPSDPRVLNLLGVALHQAGRVADAAAAYQRAIAVSPVLPEALLNNAAAAAELGDHRRAYDLAAAFLRAQTNSMEGWTRLGLEQLALGKPADAELSLQWAAQLHADKSRPLNALGLVRVAQKREADAAAFFAKALEVNPASAPARLNLAIMQLARRDTNAARATLEAYLALIPPPANRDDVAALLESLRPPPAATPAVSPVTPAAKESSKDAAAKAPMTNAPVVVAPKNAAPAPQAKAAAKKSAPAPATNTAAAPPREKAPADRPVAVAKAPEPPPATPPASSTFSLKPPAGVKRYAYSKEPAPQAGNRVVAQPFFEAGNEAARVRNYRLAMTEFATAITADPAYFEAQYNLGLAAQQNRDSARAAEAYERALSINPTRADVRYSFAYALHDLKCWYDALVELDRVLAADASNVSAHLLAAKIYAEDARDKALARRHYLRVLELDPRHSQAGNIRDWLTVNPG